MENSDLDNEEPIASINDHMSDLLPLAPASPGMAASAFALSD